MRSIGKLLLAASVAAGAAALAADDVEFSYFGPKLKGKVTPEVVAKLKAKADWNAKPLAFDREATDEDLKTVELLKDDLQRLSLDGCGKITDLSPLAACAKLKSLNLKSVSFKDYAFLASLKELEEIEFFQPKIQGTGSQAMKDISVFSGLTKLKRVHFYASPIADLAPLAGLTAMEDLSLYMAKAPDLAPLKGLTKLKRLDLYASPADDLTPLAGLTELTYIWLYMTKCKDYAVLKNCTKMEELDVTMSTFSELDVITAMPKLRKLGLWRCPVQDWKALRSVAATLEELNVERTSFADTALLDGFKKLKHLNVAGCAVKDLAPLGKLPALEMLSLQGIQGITDLTVLKDAPKLRYVYFAKDQVAPEVIAKLKEAKPKLNVSVSSSKY